MPDRSTSAQAGCGVVPLLLGHIEKVDQRAARGLRQNLLPGKRPGRAERSLNPPARRPATEAAELVDVDIGVLLY